MDSLGHFLQQGRQEAGLSLEEVAQRTRIRIESLEALEKEDLESLPTEPYVRGFVKLVCRELGLAPQEGLLRYETLRASASPPDEMLWSEERTVEAPGRLERALENPAQVVARARSLARAGVWVGGGLVVLLLVWGITRLIPTGDGREVAAADPPRKPAAEVRAAAPEKEKEKEEAKPEPKQEAKQEAKPEAKAPEAAPPKPEPTPGAGSRTPAIDALPLENVGITPKPIDTVQPEKILVTVTPAGRDGKVPGAATEKASASPEIPASSPTPAETPAQAPTQTQTPTQTPTKTVAQSQPAPTVVPRPPAGNRVVLEVEALRDVKVTVLLDGTGYPRSRMLTAGSRQSWKADELFLLSADDGGAVRLRLGGRDLGVPGANGVPLDRMELRAGS
jgi:cytoskeletal protein RodZ